MIDLDVLVLQEEREKGIARLKQSLSDLCITRKTIIDYNAFVPPCLLSASTKSTHHRVIEQLHNVFSKEGLIGINYLVMAMQDFYLDYINLISDFAEKKNVFMIESGYGKLKERIDRLKIRRKRAKFEKDAWEELILDISLPVYNCIFKSIKEIRNGREEFFVPDGEEYEINQIKGIINQTNGNNKKLSDFEKEFVANVLYNKADGFSNNRLVVNAMRNCYRPMKKHHLRNVYPRVLLINFENFSLNKYNIYN